MGYAALCAAAFAEGITEADYHTLVGLLRVYAAARECESEEARVRALHGWPAHYDPCDHMEALRFAVTFRCPPTRVCPAARCCCCYSHLCWPNEP